MYKQIKDRRTACIGMHLCRDISKFEMATIGWFTHINTPTDREAVKMVAIAVTARFIFGLEEVNEAT